MRSLPPLVALILTAAAPIAAPATPPTPPAAAAAADTPAAPLRPSSIAGDATFVVHFDFESLRTGPIGDALGHDELALAFDDPETWQKARPLIEETLSVTLYGGRFGEEHSTVLLVRTRAEVDEFFAAIAAQGEAPALREEGGRRLHVWSAHDGTVYAYADPRPAAGEVRTVIASQSRKDFDAAIALLEGRGASLETSGSPLAEMCRPRRGAFVFAAVTDLEPLRKHEHAAVLRNAEHLRLELGEHAGSTFAEIAVTTPTEDTARQMGDVCRGLVAMGQMFLAQEPDCAEARELLSGLAVTTQDRTTTISLTCQSAKVVSALKAACADRPMVKKPKATPADDAPVAEEKKPR